MLALRLFRDSLKDSFHQSLQDKLDLYSTVVAFYAFLSAFPVVTAILSLYSFFSSQMPDAHGLWLQEVIPREIRTLLGDQVRDIVENKKLSGLGSLISLLASLWSANMATQNLIGGLNVAFSSEKKRGFVRFNLVSLGFTLFFILATVVFLVMLSWPHVLDAFWGINAELKHLFLLSNGLLLIIFFVGSLTFIYRFVPHHETKRPFRSYLPGAWVAAFLGVLLSIAFSFYISNFGTYNQVYGALASVVVFMFWLQLSSFFIFFGAKFNCVYRGHRERTAA